MKKLTAGIFSVLMGLVSVNAAEAAVASKGYVDTKVGLNTEAINALNTKVGEKDVATQISEATSSLSSDTTDLKTRMATAESGLTAVQNLSATNEAAIETLNGADNVAGSVANKVKALADGAVKTNTDAIAAMDLNKVGADGQYIKFVEQADGKVTAEAAAFTKVALTEVPADCASGAATCALVYDVATKGTKWEAIIK